MTKKPQNPKYFLAKSEPSTYSITDLKNENVTPWNGVHNYMAINTIKSWNIGDFVLIYHSMKELRIVGLGRVVTTPHKDEDDPRGISWVADIEFVREFVEEHKITLKEIKACGEFADFNLVKNSRLSVMECPPAFIEWLEKKGLNLKPNN